MKIKKLLTLLLALFLIHLALSLLYIPIADELKLNETLNSKEKFHFAFSTFYLALLFPFILGFHIIIKKEQYLEKTP